MKTLTPRNTRFLPLCLTALLTLVGSAPAAQEPQEATPEPEASAAPRAERPEDARPEPPRYVTGANRSFQDVASDLFYWGQSATLTGRLLDNVFAGGQFVSLEGGTVGGDLFAFASQVTIDGEVLGDVYAFTSQIRVAEDAVIHGNLTAFAGTLQIHGTVRGHVLGAGGGTVIAGDVGAVDIEAGGLTVTETARVRGTLAYESNAEADIAEQAQIDGEVQWSRADEDDEDAEDEAAAGIGFWSVAWTLWRYVSALLVGTVLLLVGGQAVRQPARSLGQRPASGLGFGFVVAVVFPVACLAAMVLIVTLPLGVFGLVVYGLLLFLSGLVAAQFLGGWVLRRLRGGVEPSEYAALALGLALLLLVAFIPYLGFLIRLVAVILGLGGIYLALRHYGFPTAGRPSPSAAGAGA